MVSSNKHSGLPSVNKETLLSDAFVKDPPNTTLSPTEKLIPDTLKLVPSLFIVVVWTGKIGV